MSCWPGFPHATLVASGTRVGLPDGQMGNSEVGHTNMGAGRVVYQDLTRIDKAIVDGEFQLNPVLTHAFDRCRDRARDASRRAGVRRRRAQPSSITLKSLIDMAEARWRAAAVRPRHYRRPRHVSERRVEYLGDLSKHGAIGLGEIASVSGDISRWTAIAGGTG